MLQLPLPVEACVVVERRQPLSSDALAFAIATTYAGAWLTTAIVHTANPPSDHDLRELGRIVEIASRP